MGSRAGAENLALTEIRSPDSPARSQSLNILRYPATLHLEVIVIYVPSNTQRGREMYLLLCKTNRHDTYRVLPKKQNVNLARCIVSWP